MQSYKHMDVVIQSTFKINIQQIKEIDIDQMPLFI